MPQKTNAPDFAFIDRAGKKPVHIVPLTAEDYSTWLKKSPASLRNHAEQASFAARPGQILPVYDDKGALKTLVAGVRKPFALFDLAPVYDYVSRSFSDKILKGTSFVLEGVPAAATEKACIGWGLAAYRFNAYKSDVKSAAIPRLVWPVKADRAAVLAQIESASLIRTLINIPANDLGPDELEKAARKFATAEGMTVKVVRDETVLKRDFPMVYAVGKGSARRPRLIDLSWGNAKHPKLTLVGKGVCFDTGGLNLKPGSAMYTMKKDMGGAAHVLGLAMLIVRHKLPVRLRVLIPAVENAISGDSYRPADVLKSRKGLSVEVGDTDAEGRLVLADALTLAGEEKPDLLIDFATLTGAARVALGMDIPALFSNHENLAFAIRDCAMAAEDPLWPMPLWQGYRKDMNSDIADISSTGSNRAGAIAAALFLESFVDAKTEWVHVDLSAWVDSAKPGRSKGGAEMGSRAMFAYLQKRFSKK